MQCCLSLNGALFPPVGANALLTAFDFYSGVTSGLSVPPRHNVTRAMIRLKCQTRVFAFHYEPHMPHMVAVVVPITFEGRGACVSTTAGVTQHGAQGRRTNVILAVNRTLREGMIA